MDGIWVWNNCSLGEVMQETSSSMVQIFYFVLESAVLSRFENDTVRWLLDVQAGYSVCSGMVLFPSRQIGFPLNVSCSDALKLVWSSTVPFSIKAFGW